MTTSNSPASAAPVPRSLAIREGDFLEWLDRARPGDRLEYHQGHLGVDRELGMLSQALRLELGRIADHAMEFALQGRLHLVQVRRGKDAIAYLAVMATPAPVRRRAA